MIKGLNSVDLTFLFGSRMPEINKKIEQIKREEGKELVDIDILNRLSNGRGVEAYNKLSQFRLQSKEYYSAFDFSNKKKTLDLKTKEGVNMHVYRNKNQYGKAPKDLNTMRKFVKAGYFIEEGYSACHNILKNNNTPEARKKSLQIMIYYVRHIKKDATEAEQKAYLKKYTPYSNISFRGTPGSSFEGCQFIYNDKTGKLVVDNVNRGTWDYGKYGTTAHFLYDISPWLEMGNGENIETADLFIMSPEQEKKYLAMVVSDKIKRNIINTTNDMNTAVNNIVKLIGETVKTGSGKSIEDIKPIINGDEYLAEQRSIVEETRQNYINNFIDNNSEKLQREYDTAYETLTSVLDFMASEDFRKDVAPFVDSISVDYVKFENNKDEFVKQIMYASINAGDVSTRGANAEIDIPLNISVKVIVGENFKRNMFELLECNEPAAINEFNRIKEFITTTLNKKLEEFNKDSSNKFKLRILTDNVDNTFDEIEYSVEYKHTMSKNEDIVCSKKTFSRSLSDEEKQKMNLPVLEEEATENLNIYHKPEWM